MAEKKIQSHAGGTDEELMLRFIDGDNKAFSVPAESPAIYNFHKRSVFKRVTQRERKIIYDPHG
ncbi:MAG: hypothetical protein JST15_13995 [Bacteroidetes bacterium]|nr:hypothetical protein [Bacteroidota bacterium]